MPSKCPRITDSIAVILGVFVAGTMIYFQSKIDTIELIVTKMA